MVTFLLVLLWLFFPFWVVGWRNLNNRIHNHIKIRLILLHRSIEPLIDKIQGPWINFGNNDGMFFIPALENLLEIGAPLGCLLEYIDGILIEVVFDGVGRDHEVQDDALVVQVVDGVVDDVLHILGVVEDGLVPDVPPCLLNQVGQEYHLDLVQHVDLAYCLEDLADGVQGAVGARA